MKRWYPITVFLIVINFVIGLQLQSVHWNPVAIFAWGGMTGDMPTAQPLSSFPGLSGLGNTVISGPVLLIVRATYASLMHFSWEHLVSNMVTLFLIGQLFEINTWFGTILPVYWLTGVISMISASILQPDAITVGASGAIFGIMGAALVLGIRAKRRHDVTNQMRAQYQEMTQYAYFLIVLNIISTFMTANVSVVGHISGLAAGAILGLIIPIKDM